MPPSLSIPVSGKTIRDPIHGDIVIKDKFIDLIDTPEFQRLRRISQLGLTNFLFPAAEHSRFSHSIGTYHVMNLIIKHFKKVLANINLSEELGTEKINLALAAALLHDVGHGPFSHTFEQIADRLLGREAKSHEKWTRQIILSSDSQLKKVLKENFGSQFPRQVADLIGNDYQWGINKKQKAGFEQINLLNIISSLVSSQLDADRMDYLLRDTYFTGVAYGNFDLSRLINSLSITRKGNNYYVCIPEKYLSTVEEYLISRYQMYKEIYSHEFKREMELLLEKIILRANLLYDQNKLKTNLPAALKALFREEKISVQAYIELDDVSMLALIKEWRTHSDQILAKLCRIFLNRTKFTQLNIGEGTKSEVEDFKTELTSILAEVGFDKQLSDSFFWLEGDAEEDLYQELYQEEQEQIDVLNKQGERQNFIEVSKVIRRAKSAPQSSKKKITFINFSILQEEVNASSKLISRIKELIEPHKKKKVN